MSSLSSAVSRFSGRFPTRLMNSRCRPRVSVPASHLSKRFRICHPRVCEINEEYEMRMDRQAMLRCMEVVAEYRASGQRCGVWAAPHGMSSHALSSWCRHEKEWRAIIDGVDVVASSSSVKPKGFVAARLPSHGAANSVRVELCAGATRLDMQWPLSHTRELAALVRELAR